MSGRRKWWSRHPVAFFFLGELICVALVVAGSVVVSAPAKQGRPTQPLEAFGWVAFGVGFVVGTVGLLWALVYLGQYLFGSARRATKESRKEPSGRRPDPGPPGSPSQDQARPAGEDGHRGSGQSPHPSARRRSSFFTARRWRRQPSTTDGAPETGTPPPGQRQNGQPPTPATPAARARSRVPGPAGPAAKRWLYADIPVDPTDPDALSFGAYADALALLMDTEDTNTPLTIAINGPWGSGKTSLAKMTEGRLAIGSDWDAPHVICWFDAWANDDAPHLGAAFAAAVAKAVNNQRYWWMRLAMPLPSSMLSPQQRWSRRLCYGVLAVALAAIAVFWPTGRSWLTPFAHAGTTISALGHGTAATRLAWPALAVAVLLIAQQLAPGIQGVARWIGAPGSEAARGSMAEASGQLGHLIKQALRGNRRLIILVDNLERCRPPRAVEVCEVVSQLIGHPDVVTVLIGDIDTIALSAEIKYAALETVSRKGRTTGAYGRAYLEKLIQIQLRLPPPLPENLRKMLMPTGDEPLAVPQDASTPDPGFKAATADSTAAVSSSRRPGVSLAILSSVVTLIVTIATFGADIPAFLLGLAAFVLSALTERAVDRLGERRKKQDRTVIDDAVSKVLTAADKGLNPKKEEEIIEALREAVRNDEDGEISSTLREQIVLDDPDERTRWIIRRRMRQYLVSNTKLRTSLDNAVLRFLPLSPRGAKRMFNHAHLLLDTGIGRGVFYRQALLGPNQPPSLSADQLAAWIALTERWPSVAAAITADPTLMEKLELEARATASGLEPKQVRIIGKKIGIDGLDAALLDLLRSTESLAPVVRTLVNFSPDLSPFTQRSARSARKPHSSGPAQPANAGQANIPAAAS
jgi:hypothetical protein